MSKMDYIKAIRRANREAELDDEHGWKVKNKAFKNKKHYSRKNKWKKIWNSEK